MAAKKKPLLPKSTNDWKIVKPEDARKEVEAIIKKKSGKKRPGKSSNRAQQKPGTGQKPAKNNKKTEIKKDAAEASPKKPGRSTKYDADTHPLKAWLLAVLGKTNIEIAAELTISTKTLHEWGKKHPEFLSSVKQGKAISNARVVKALFRRCIGEKVVRKKIIQNADGSMRKEIHEEEVLPDVAAISLWLPNRDPENWKSSRVALSGDPGSSPLLLQVTNMSDEDLRKKVAEILARQPAAGGP